MSQILVNGLFKHTDYRGAYEFIRKADNWIAAYPHGSGLPNGVLRPIKKQYAPVYLTELEILGILPYVGENDQDVSSTSMADFSFAALVTLESTEHLALQHSLKHGYWLDPHYNKIFTDITWSKAALVGAFHHLTASAVP